jgi:hypothetical protein
MATQNYLSINRGQADGQTGNVLVATATDLGTGKTNLASFLTAYDAVGAAIVAISGDSYSATTHQFTNGGSTGLTSAQLHTELTALNSAITTFLAGNTIVAAFPTTADFVLAWLSTHSPTRKDVLMAMKSFENYLNADGVAGGQRGTDLPPL